MGKFVVNGAIDATNHITIKNGSDLYLQAPSSSPNDSGDLVFTKYDGTEQGRIWISGGIGMIRFSSSDTNKTLIHSGNIGSQSVNYANSAANATYASYIKDSYNSSNITITYGKSGQSSTSWLASWNGYELGAISPTNLSVGYATNANETDYNRGGSIPWAGSFNSEPDTTQYRSMFCTYMDSSSTWWNLISNRHRNGASDGTTYGMYLKSRLTGAGQNLLWNRQYDGSWQGERILLDSSNYSSWCAPASHTHSYLPLDGTASSANWASQAGTLARGGNSSYPMTFYWSGQSGQPNWLWGGNDGTNMYVYNPSNFSVNYATSAGSADSATASNNLTSTGFGSSSFTYLQTSATFYEATGWAHYLISNHGDGASYYNYVLRLPFWGSPQYKYQTGSASSVFGWYNFHTTENVIVQSSQPTADFVGQIWLKI